MRENVLRLKTGADVLDVKDLASVLGISEKTAYGLLKSKQIHSIRIGNRYRIPKKSVYHYLNNS